MDGTEGKPYDNIIHAVAFSSDGKHVAYAAIEGRTPSWSLTGQKGRGTTLELTMA